MAFEVKCAFQNLSRALPPLFIYVFMKLFSKFDRISLITSAPLETVKRVIGQKAAYRTPWVLRVRHVGHRVEIENSQFTNESFAT